MTEFIYIHEQDYLKLRLQQYACTTTLIIKY